MSLAGIPPVIRHCACLYKLYCLAIVFAKHLNECCILKRGNLTQFNIRCRPERPTTICGSVGKLKYRSQSVTASVGPAPLTVCMAVISWPFGSVWSSRYCCHHHHRCHRYYRHHFSSVHVMFPVGQTEPVWLEDDTQVGLSLWINQHSISLDASLLKYWGVVWTRKLLDDV